MLSKTIDKRLPSFNVQGPSCGREAGTNYNAMILLATGSGQIDDTKYPRIILQHASPLNSGLKKIRVLTADDLAGLLEAVVNKISKPHSQQARPDIEVFRKRQEKGTLCHKLAQERQEKVNKAIECEAPLEEKLAALGVEDSISPLQLVKLSKGQIPQEQLALPRSNGHNVVCRYTSQVAR